MIVNADELKLFRTIYETESLSEAAARLQLSLPKASRQLASLRKTFGDKLFVRCDHRMCPTLRARSLLPKVDALLSGFEALECPGVFSVEQLRHVFRIAGLDNALLSYFGPVLDALGRHAPGVRLNFHSISSNFYAELHQGRIDLAVYATQESFPTFRRLAICEDAYVYVARGTSELARRVLSGQVLTHKPQPMQSAFTWNFMGSHPFTMCYQQYAQSAAINPCFLRFLRRLPRRHRFRWCGLQRGRYGFRWR